MSKKKETCQLQFPRWVNSKYNPPIHVVGIYDKKTDPNILINGKGYVIEDYIYQYISEVKVEPLNPYFYFDLNGDIVTCPGIDCEKIHISESIVTTVQSIAERTNPDKELEPDENFIQPASSESIFIPEIKEKDDFLKKIIKMVFRIKKVSTLRYKKKLSKSYAFPNLYQSLNADTKTSTTVWQTWIELLGLDMVLIVKDSGGDSEYPIKDYIAYNSRNDTLEIVPKDQIEEYLRNKL